MIRCLACVLLAVLWLAPGPGHAEPADAAFAALASTSFESIRQGVEGLTTSGHPRAQIVITALQNGTLYMRQDKALFIKNDDGRFVDALTGAASDAPAAALRPVRVNNAVRGAIDAALGALRLFSPDASTRLAAAEAVFLSRDPAAIPALDRALEKETDPDIKRKIEQARAAAVLSSPDATEADRLAAIVTLRAAGDYRSPQHDREFKRPISRRRCRRTDRDHRDRSQSATLVAAGECLLRSQPWFRSAAGRRRIGNHFRCDGRHQHGAR